MTVQAEQTEQQSFSFQAEAVQILDLGVSQAVLTLGARMEDPAAFVTRLNGLLAALAEGTDNSAAANHKDSRCQ
jgi:hypothetical protein